MDVALQIETAWAEQVYDRVLSIGCWHTVLATDLDHFLATDPKCSLKGWTSFVGARWLGGAPILNINVAVDMIAAEWTLLAPPAPRCEGRYLIPSHFDDDAGDPPCQGEGFVDLYARRRHAAQREALLGEPLREGFDQGDVSLSQGFC